MSQGLKGAPEALVLRGMALNEEPRALALQAVLQPESRGPLGRTELTTTPREGGPGRHGLVEAADISPADALLRDQVEQAKAGGFREGFEQGKQEGVEQGLKEGREKAAREALLQTEATREAVSERLERLDAWLGNLSLALDQHHAARLTAVEEDMVVLSASVALRFLGEQVLSEEAVAHGVRQAVLQCREGGEGATITAIHVHPQDLECLSAAPELSQWFQHRGMPSVAWVPDETIRMGGCIIRSDQGTLDARLETQFSGLQKLLIGVRLDQRTSGAEDPRSGAGEA